VEIAPDDVVVDLIEAEARDGHRVSPEELRRSARDRRLRLVRQGA
jgi:hypothetical protein